MRFLILTALILSTRAPSVENPGQIAEQLRARQDAETVEAAMAWLKTADLTDLPAAKLPADPRESERLAAIEAGQVNELLGTLRIWKAKVEAGDKEAAAQLCDWFRRLRPNEPILARMTGAKSASH